MHVANTARHGHDLPMDQNAATVFLFGATGTIGRACHTALIAAGYHVIAPVRRPCDLQGSVVTAFDAASLGALMGAHRGAYVMSCLASRTGAAVDAAAIDRDLHLTILRASLSGQITRFVQLSAICVQKPRLPFQHAKLAFENTLRSSPVTWTIVRPTAYFKSLSGQLARVQNGKPFLVFGNGRLTACKPISNDDLAGFMVKCLTDPACANCVLPVGGRGPAITPLDQARMIFDATGMPPKIKHIPISVMTTLIRVLSGLGRIIPALRPKADLARIGHYYATQSMLVWDADAQRYDADATPEYGSQTLADHYRHLVATKTCDDRGDHAVF